ncbi:MAG: LysR family transcriptional regulator [Pseudomonadota bacterium]|nr:LysR family transcriptional regulator [Pseudomonadota bacterium]
MSKIDDMALFVHVVKAGGLAAAGRKLGLSPASMTARINKIEQSYDTRLLTRNTRSIALTDAGERFYSGCLRVLAEVENTENILQESQQSLRGQLKLSATSDFGRQFVAPALAEFINSHPDVKPHLVLTDGVTNIVEEGIDLAFRFGNLPDSNLISRPLCNNRRVLCASPSYIKSFGLPRHPEDLKNHRCLVLERLGQPLNDWHFEVDNTHFSIKLAPHLSCSDGEVIRRWANQGHGIALKSYIDIKNDLKTGDLILILDEYVRGFSHSDKKNVGLQVIYPSRQFQPRQVKAFIEFFECWFKKHC